jgi:hypothetical protein
MRSYENAGYNPYNDNDRSQSRGSARNYYSDEFDITRGERGAHRLSSNLNTNKRSGDFGAGRDSFASSGYGGTSTYGRSAGSSNYGSSGNRYSSDRDRYGSEYGSSSNYGSRYGSDRNNDNWGDRIEDTWDRTKNRVSNAWDRVTGDDDNDNYRNRNYGSYGSGSSYSGRYGSDNDYGSGTGYTRNYGSGNYGSGSSYGSGSLGTGSTGYGSTGYGSGTYGTGYTTSSNYGSDRGRYSSDYDRSNRYSSDYDRDRDNDRGFFDKAGDEVRSWFGDDEAERRRRMDEMRDRQHDRDYGTNRYGSSSTGSSYSGPPYSYGSSSRRDYEW